MAMLSLLRRFSSFGGYGPAIGPSGIASGGGAASFEELQTAIDAAWLVEREPDEDGPRVAVISPTLRGSFFYSREEAARRINLAFPGTDPVIVRRAVRHLENRVRAKQNPPLTGKRRNWVHDWREG